MQTPTSTPYTVNELKQFFGYTNQQQSLDNNTLWTPNFYHHLINESCFTFFTITDYTKMKYLFVSPMVESVTGYTRQMFATGGLEFMLSLVHPAEMGPLRLIHQQMIAFFNAQPHSEKTDYNYAYDVRIRKADGTYMRLFCQLSCEQLADDGSLLLGKEMFTDITLYNDAPYMQLVISHHAKTTGNHNLIYRFDTTSKSKLSAREKEVSDLVTRGLSSKEIGKILNLSKHTIDTYRRKIKKKADCRKLQVLWD